MTEALEAMLKAMAAEFSRQDEEARATGASDVVIAWLEDDGRHMGFGVDGGRIDLEKVAQAGLLAIREPTAAMTFAASTAAAEHHFPHQSPTSYTSQPLPVMLTKKLLSAMIDAILNEKAPRGVNRRG